VEAALPAVEEPLSEGAVSAAVDGMEGPMATGEEEGLTAMGGVDVLFFRKGWKNTSPMAPSMRAAAAMRTNGIQTVFLSSLL
jgi:hypothetical protein